MRGGEEKGGERERERNGGGLDSDNRGSEKHEKPFERATLDVGLQNFPPAVLDNVIGLQIRPENPRIQFYGLNT